MGDIIRDRIEWKGHNPPIVVWPSGEAGERGDDRNKNFTPQVGYDTNALSSKNDQQDAGSMADPTREEFDAKLAAAEARTEALLARIDGKIDRISDAVIRLESDVAASRREWRQEAGALRLWLVTTGIAVFLGVAAVVAGTLAYGLASIQLGVSAAPPQVTVLPFTTVPLPQSEPVPAVPPELPPAR